MRLLLAALSLYLILTSPFLVVVSSESMEPTLKVGDLVFLSHRDPSVGDVIVYEHNGILIIHRLIAVNDDGTYTTKGDNPVTNPTPDPRPVYPDQVVGVAILRIPLVGYFVLAVREYPFILLPLFILIAFYDRFVPEVKRRYKREMLVGIVLLLLLLWLHPWVTSSAYLIKRDAYLVGENKYFVKVLMYASGNDPVHVVVYTLNGSVEFIRKPVFPGTTGERSVGLFVYSKPVEVRVWTRSPNGEESMSRRV